MIKHIVMFRMKPEKTTGYLPELKDRLQVLKNKIPEVLHLETGLNISQSPSAFDLVLITEFNDEEALQTYREHPDHQEVLKFIRENVEEVKVVDYLI